MRQVTIKYVWQCGLCSEEIDTFSNVTIPAGWYRLDGCRCTQFIVGEGEYLQTPPERIICPRCALVLKRALDFTKTPYQIIESGAEKYNKSISPGLLTLMG